MKNRDYTHDKGGNDGLIESRARLARENRQKWWSHHIPLGYAVLMSAFLAIYLGFALVDRHIALAL